MFSVDDASGEDKTAAYTDKRGVVKSINEGLGKDSLESE